MDERSTLTKYLPCFVVCLCVSAIISNVKEKLSYFTKVSNAMISYGLETRLVAPPNWASEASPILGCSIEISRDIYARAALELDRRETFT